MKIGYLCPDLGIAVDGCKGASSHIRGFCQALKNLGHHVDLLSPNGGDVTIAPPQVLHSLSQDSNSRTYRALKHLFYNGAIEEALENYIQQEKPDLIYERYSPFSIAGGAICQKLKIPHFLEVNSPLAEQGKLYRKQALQEAAEYLELAAIENAKVLVALTDELKTWLMQLGVSENRIILKPCAVDTEQFCPGKTPYQLDDKIVLGFCGSLKPWHDLAMIDKAFRALAHDPRLHLMIVGDGPMRHISEKLKTDFPTHVTLTGGLPQDQIPDVIRAIDIPLAPYPHLDFFYFSPLKIFEYMACKKATVATQIGQISTVIEHGKTGLLVPPENLEQTLLSIRWLIDHPKERDQMGNAAMEQVCKKHTWHLRAKQWIKDVENFL
jgi:glycosyltransferase involved in cell wall biosynthesis